ncbi:uncharacterized protein LOC133524806 [Cydia pomonella]|uniref:uncharacterized protein LOC133524806 n=1 Tax=Cydia pomonella TaxID=82600 RepID=UPI002ADE1CB6|nr:uncharacterized protein LOC133524806 [Cydia pomonella]
MKFSTIISPQALSQIIPETCDALYEVLRKEYLKFPKTEQDWRIIAREFEQKWNFPHCLGAIDGKHVEIVPPSNSGSFYYNYKHRHSMVLLAIVDAKYRFLLVDFGTNGRVSDGGVLLNTKFYEKLERKTLNIPTAERLHPRILPYVFVADDAFPLRKDMIKPFRQNDLDSRIKKIYNYQTSRARRIVENAFGIIAARFRIYRTQMNLSPETIGSVVRATCALHNYLTSSSLSYASSECFDIENFEEGTITSGLTTRASTLEPLQRTIQGRAPQIANQIRSQFMTYFVSEGKVPWHDNFIH